MLGDKFTVKIQRGTKRFIFKNAYVFSQTVRREDDATKGQFLSGVKLV